MSAQPHTTRGLAEWTVDDVFRRLPGMRVIDVREPDEYTGELGHIPGAELVPLATLPARAASWDRNAAVVLVCRSGARSGRAAATLLASGFVQPINMVGGMIAWNARSLPVERR